MYRLSAALKRALEPWRARGRWRTAGALLGLALLAATAPAAAGSFLVGFAQDDLANDWRAAQVDALQRAFADAAQVRFIYTDARGSTARQVQDIEDLVARGVDVLITSPRDSAAMTPVIRRVHRAGTPVVLLTRRIETDDFTTFIHPDDCGIGRRAARFLERRLGGSGRILVLGGVPGTTTAQQRTGCFREAVAAAPGLTVVAVRTANYLRGDAIQVMERVLAEGPAFDAIFAESDSMAAGARIALRGAGIDPATIPTVGVDYISEARRAIREGLQDATFTYPTCAEQGAELTLRILRGERVSREVTVPSVMVTAENVDRVEPIF